MNQVEQDYGPVIGLMAIVCTDRGQHKRTRLADVRWYAHGHWRMTSPVSKHQSFHPPLNRDGQHSNYVFDCPRCARTPYFSRSKWIEIVEGRFHPRTWDAGGARAEFDVSEVPF